MANISRLIIGLGVDPGELQRGLQQGITAIRTFSNNVGTTVNRGFRTATDGLQGFLARFRQGFGGGLQQDLVRSVSAFDRFGTQIQQTLSKVDLFGNLTPAAGKAVRSLVEGLGSQYAAQVATLRRQLADGLIDQPAFQVAGLQAFATFQTGLRTGFRSFTNLKLIDPNLVTGLVAQFQAIGARAEQGLLRAAAGTGILARGLREVSDLLNNRFTQVLGFGALILGIRRVTEEANADEAALRKLHGTAALLGAPFEALRSLAEQTGSQFAVSTALAVDYTDVVARLTASSGQIGQTSNAIQALLDVAVSRGQSPAEALDSIQSALTGVGRSAEKLLGVDLDVFYARLARTLHTTVANLNQQQRTQGVLNALMEQGGKVVGAYGAYLETAAGKTQVLQRELSELLAQIGRDIQPAVTFAVEQFRLMLAFAEAFVGGIKIMAVNFGVNFAKIPEHVQGGVAAILEALGVLALHADSKLSVFGVNLGAGLATKLFDTAEDLRGKAKANIAVLEQYREQAKGEIVGIQDAIRLPTLTAEKPVGAPLDPAVVMKALQTQIQSTITILNSAVARQATFTEPLKAAVGLYNDLNARIEASGGKITETTAALVQMRSALAEAIRTANVSVLNRELEPLERRLTLLQGRAAGGGPGLGADPRVTMADLVTLHEELNAKARALGPITIDNAGAFGSLVVLMVQASTAMDKISKAGGKLLDEDGKAGIFDPRTMTSSLDAILNIGTALAGIATSGAFGELDDDMQNAISSTLALLGALEQVRESMAKGGGGLASLAGIAGLIGAVGAGIGLLSSVLGGGGPSAHDELIRANNDRLDALRVALNSNIDSVNRLRDAQAAIPRLDIGKVEDAIFAGRGIDPQAGMAELERQLNKMGFTFAELNVIAKDHGIELLADGVISAEALQQLQEALGFAVESLTTFGQSLDDQRALTDARNRIFGRPDTPGQEIADIGGLFSSQAKAVWERLFAGIDTTTGAGQDALRARVTQLFKDLEAGLIPLEAFGDLNLDQIIELILGIDTALDALEKNLVAFNDTLEEQRARLQLRDALAGKTTAVDTINRELELLGQFAPAIADMFVGIDTTTTEGRTLLRTALQNLFNLLDAGLISDAMLGQLTGADQLADIIGIIVGALGGLGDAVDGVTRAMHNLPTGFRIDAARFQAQDFAGFDTGERPTILRPPPQPTHVVNHWEVIVTANGVNDPEKIATQTVVALQRKALAQGVRNWTDVVPT